MEPTIIDSPKKRNEPSFVSQIADLYDSKQINHKEYLILIGNYHDQLLRLHSKSNSVDLNNLLIVNKATNIAKGIFEL